jgi:hypothetical protein
MPELEIKGERDGELPLKDGYFEMVLPRAFSEGTRRRSP